MTQEITVAEKDNELSEKDNKKDKNLTEKQLIFVNKIVDGYGPSDAAKLAGYEFPEQSQYYLKNLPHVQNAIMAKVQTKFLAELLPKATRAIEELITKTDTPAPTRLKASEFVVNKAVELTKLNSISDLAKIDPNNMSIQELEIMVMKGRAIINQQSQPPVDNQSYTSQAIDLIEESS